jgi:hypothetical protein
MYGLVVPHMFGSTGTLKGETVVLGYVGCKPIGEVSMKFGTPLKLLHGLKPNVSEGEIVFLFAMRKPLAVLH